MHVGRSGWCLKLVHFVHKTVEVHEAQGEVNKAQVEVYKAQVEVHKAEVEVHTGKVEVPKGQVEVPESQVELHGAFCRPTSVICMTLPTSSSMSEAAEPRATQVRPSPRTVEVCIHGLVLLDLLSVAVLNPHAEVSTGRRAVPVVCSHKLCPQDSRGT